MLSIGPQQLSQHAILILVKDSGHVRAISERWACRKAPHRSVLCWKRGSARVSPNIARKRSYPGFDYAQANLWAGKEPKDVIEVSRTAHSSIRMWCDMRRMQEDELLYQGSPRCKYPDLNRFRLRFSGYVFDVLGDQ